MKAIFKKIAFTVLFVLCLMLGCVYISAAENNMEEVYIQDENGTYLQKKEEGWFLFNKEQSPLSGVQYISVSPGEEFETGFYMVSDVGELILEQAMYKLEKQEVHGVLIGGGTTLPTAKAALKRLL